MIYFFIFLYLGNGVDGGVFGSSVVFRIVDVMSVCFFKFLNKILNYFYFY